jgi:DNA-binding transcriptional regulator/RsmH inhibitor MraZ
MSRTVGLSKEVELVGRLDKFEIWNPGRYERVSAQDTEMAMQAIKEIEL